MKEAGEKYNRQLIRWVKNHYWNSLEPEKDLILRHLRTFTGESELPKDKPPLLKYQCSHAITAGSYEWHNIEGYNQGTQAQREADIKWYTS